MGTKLFLSDRWLRAVLSLGLCDWGLAKAPKLMSCFKESDLEPHQRLMFCSTVRGLPPTELHETQLVLHNPADS